MLGLPQSTELSKQLPKKAIYAKFQMNSAAKDRMDADVSRITIVNELSPSRINIADGSSVHSFYVLLITLKRKEFDEKNIILISKLIPQNMILLLEYNNEAKLAVYRSKLLQTNWQNRDSLTIQLSGLDFDKVWENIIIQIGKIKLDDDNSLDEQIQADEKRERILSEISRIEKQARSEKQPRKKFDLVKKINSLKAEVQNG